MGLKGPQGARVLPIRWLKPAAMDMRVWKHFLTEANGNGYNSPWQADPLPSALADG